MTDASTAPDLPGLTVERLLGRGGFAEVYLCEQERPRMRVAVKVLSGEGLSEDARQRFAAEANAMAVLADHPYIVQVFRSDVTADGRPYLVMKYYPQVNLGVRSRAEQIPVPEVLRIGVRIASAVETAHRAGILHRDIKPANILTSQFGEPGLTDFGIATMAGVDSTTSEGMSIPWSPPEIVFGASNGDRASDIYGLGATLWHLLAGRSPFEIPGSDNSNLALMRRIKDMPAPRTGRPDVPASLERILAQALSKDPAERPDSALALARSLQAVEAEQRWAPTPLVIEDAPRDSLATTETRTEAPDRVQLPDEQGQSTRRRPTQVVAQQMPTSPATPEPALEIEPSVSATHKRSPVRVRVGLPDHAEVAPTIRRAKSPGVAELSPTDEVAQKSRRALLVVSAIVVVALAIGVGVALRAGSGPSASAASTTIEASAPTLALAPASVPIVSANRVNPSQVRFNWTDPGALAGDEFLYSVDGGSYKSDAGRRYVVIDVPTGSSTCITVEIDRSGLAGSPSAATCNRN